MKIKMRSTILILMIFSAPAVNANKALMNNMVKQMSAQLKTQMEANLEMMSDPKLLKASAKYVRKYYEALIEEGFSEEQAMQIVAGSRIKN